MEIASARQTQPVGPGAGLQKRASYAALHLLALALGLGFMFPFFWTVASSLKQVSEIYAFPPPWLPAVPQWRNYAKVFDFVPFHRWVANTVFVATLSTLGRLISATMAGYSFARFEYKGRDTLFLIMLSTMMIPAQVTLIPRYILFQKLGWLNTFKPLWIPAWFGGAAFHIFLMRQFIMSLPKDLDEAALIDGANYFRIFRSIIIPLSKPVLATVTIISFIASWNAFLNPLIYLDEKKKFTLAVGLDALKTTNVGDAAGEPTFHYLMAGCVMSTTPIILLFFAAQRYFVRGIVMSGIKG